MALLDDLWSQINGVTNLVNQATSLAVNAAIQASQGNIGASPGFGGAGGFGGGGAGPSTTSTRTTEQISTPSPAQVTITPQTVTQVIQRTVEVVVPGVSPTPDLVTMITSSGGSALEIVASSIQTLAYNVNKGIQSLWTQIETIKSGLESFITGAIDGLYQKVNSVMQNLVTTLSKGLQMVEDAAINTYNIIRSYLDQGLQGLTQAINYTAATIQQGLERMARGLEDVARLVAILDSPEDFGKFFAASLITAWNTEV